MDDDDDAGRSGLKKVSSEISLSPPVYSAVLLQGLFRPFGWNTLASRGRKSLGCLANPSSSVSTKLDYDRRRSQAGLSSSSGAPGKEEGAGKLEKRTGAAEMEAGKKLDERQGANNKESSFCLPLHGDIFKY